MRKIWTANVFLLAGGLLATGCSGASYAISNYGSVRIQHFTSPSQRTPYRIYDKPTENRLMITPSIANSFNHAASRGEPLTNSAPTEALFENAAIEYLSSTGRTCVAKRTFLIIKPQFEVQYECGGLSDEEQPKMATNSSQTFSTYTPNTYRTYYRGPRGGCYYINSGGNKSYVDRSYC